jgi:hypothetical protein
MSTTGKIFEKLILGTFQKHAEERNVLNASHFGFLADHSSTLQCMRVADHITPHFNNNMLTAAVFLDIEKTFDKTWHSGLLYTRKLSELAFSTSLVKLIAFFLTNRKLKVLVEGKFSTPRNIAARAYQGSVLALILYNLYINDAPAAPGTRLALFANDTCIYATEKHEHCVLYKLQRCLAAVNSWCELWNIKINERKTQAIYFSRILSVPEDVLQLNGRASPL